MSVRRCRVIRRLAIRSRLYFGHDTVLRSDDALLGASTRPVATRRPKRQGISPGETPLHGVGEDYCSYVGARQLDENFARQIEPPTICDLAEFYLGRNLSFVGGARNLTWLPPFQHSLMPSYLPVQSDCLRGLRMF
jgi:hypothetical protein